MKCRAMHAASNSVHAVGGDLQPIQSYTDSLQLGLTYDKTWTILEMRNTAMPEVGSQAKRAATSCLWSSLRMKNFKHKPSDKITKQDRMPCIGCPSMVSDKHDLILKLERLSDKQQKETNFQTRIFLSAFRSSYSISYLTNCMPAWLFKLLSMQHLPFRFTGGGKNYIFWKLRLWVSSWDTQETKHCANVLIVGSRPSF